MRGYRRVQAGASGVITETKDLIAALVRFGQANNLPFDPARLVSLPGDALVNGLSMSLPFGATEKQALLEAASLLERQALLLTLLGMGVKAKEPDSPITPPTLN